MVWISSSKYTPKARVSRKYLPSHFPFVHVAILDHLFLRLGPSFTWRGHPPVHQAVAKYHGKGAVGQLATRNPKIQGTLPKINIEPENGELEDDFPFPGMYSQVPC